MFIILQSFNFGLAVMDSLDLATYVTFGFFFPPKEGITRPVVLILNSKNQDCGPDFLHMYSKKIIQKDYASEMGRTHKTMHKTQWSAVL